MSREYADALRGEWTKARTLASTAWLLAATIVSGVGLTAAVCAVARYGIADGQDPATLAFSGVQLAQAPAAMCGVQAVAGEYRSDLILTSLTVVPRRTILVAAKVTVVSLLALAAAALTVLGCLLVARVELASTGPGTIHRLALDAESTLRAMVAATLRLALISVPAAGIALAVRSTAAATAVVLSLLYLFPLASRFTGSPTWQHRLEQAAPATGSLGVLAVWAIASLLVGILVLQTRDS